MKSKKNVRLILGISCVLAACGSAPRKAVVEDRTSQSTQTAASSDAKMENGQAHYVVKKGDTLYRIALEKGQSYSDLITWNNLANPNDIKVGKTLRVTPPETTTGLVVVPNNVDIRPLGSARTSERTAVSSAPSGNNKNAPRADKRPYSDAMFAELQKNETADPGKVTVAPIGKTPEKATDSPSAGEVVWMWPVESKMIAGFDNGKNKGIDFSGRPGQSVYAAAAGTVMYAGSGIRGYGNLVIIKHVNNFLSAYAHNQAILVKEKQTITKGQKIAEMGNSDSDIVKLHFEIRQQGKPVDPMKFLPVNQ